MAYPCCCWKWKKKIVLESIFFLIITIMLNIQKFMNLTDLMVGLRFSRESVARGFLNDFVYRYLCIVISVQLINVYRLLRVKIRVSNRLLPLSVYLASSECNYQFHQFWFSETNIC